MKHVFVTLDGNAIGLSVDDMGVGDGPSDPVVMDYFPEDVYDGAASVLNGAAYSSRYGWLAGGLIPLHAGESIRIEAVSVSAGPEVSEGGTRRLRDMHTSHALPGTVGPEAAWA